ncbi:MAG: hypothetical protein OEQ53_18285, partial [Saprospiraceae bacterium]|nr:hypothetical protein [Saprospiraceae bacterium]
MASSELLKKVQSYAREHLTTKIPGAYLFHSAQHTEEVVEAAKDLTKGYPLKKNEAEDMLIALWFHDLGFSQGWEEHESRSAQLAHDF